MTSAPVVRTPRDLAELRTWLLAQWQYDMPYAQYVRARGSSTSNMFETTSDEWERNTIADAQLYWVSEDMVDLLLATAASVPDDVRFADLAPPAHRGMVVFAKPWYGHDSVDGHDSLRIDAMVWGGSHLGPVPERGDAHLGGHLAMSTSMYRHLCFEEGLTPDDLKIAAATRALITHATELRPRKSTNPAKDKIAMDAISAGLDETPDIPPVVAAAATKFFETHGRNPIGVGETLAVAGHSWVPLGRSDWPLGDQITEAPWAMHDSMRLSFAEDRRVLAALWTLLQQEGITRQEVHHVERHAQKRAARAGVTPEATYKVQVVTLRKLHRTESADDHVPTGRHIGVRYIRDGHFRWQPYGKGRLERRLTFIAPHICGPEGAPLRTPTRVNAWRR